MPQFQITYAVRVEIFAEDMDTAKLVADDIAVSLHDIPNCDVLDVDCIGRIEIEPELDLTFGEPAHIRNRMPELGLMTSMFENDPGMGKTAAIKTILDQSARDARKIAKLTKGHDPRKK